MHKHTANAAQYRATAAAVRTTADETAEPGNRAELLLLAEQFELLAARAEAKASAAKGNQM
jgi:hypothetical protein